jgi:hypothetical protein
VPATSPFGARRNDATPRLLIAATITYNAIEAIVAITAGATASSTALIGFGLDSINPRLVLGRSDRRPRHRPYSRQGRPRHLAGQGLLRVHRASSASRRTGRGGDRRVRLQAGLHLQLVEARTPPLACGPRQGTRPAGACLSRSVVSGRAGPHMTTAVPARRTRAPMTWKRSGRQPSASTPRRTVRRKGRGRNCRRAGRWPPPRTGRPR